MQVRPLASPARVKRRHWGLIASFFLLVLLPVAATGYYLWAVASDQYASTTGFTVRQEDSGGAAELIGGLAQFAGGPSTADSDILFEFIQSQDLVARIAERTDLVEHYSSRFEKDPVFALWPESSIEDLHDFWQRVVRVSYDQSTGLIELRVLAFDPETAQTIARAIISESEALINELNATARADTIRYAQADLDEALERLKSAREALTRFRLRTQIVDPASDLQGRMGVVNNLQQQLAQALIEYDLLVNSTRQDDPRLGQAQRRIDVIRQRITEERNTFASEETMVGGEDYPTLMAEYESLVVDREFAEESYRVALTALDIARGESARQSRYLTTYIRPTLPQSPQFPQRAMLFGLTLMFLLMAWAIMALVYYSIRDRR